MLGLRTRHPGGFRVDAVTISYQRSGRRYTAPFATNAQLTIGQQHHHAARLDPAEANPHANLAALVRPYPAPSPD